MKTVTFFEHEARTYTDIGMKPDEPAIQQIERLNNLFGTELIAVGRRELRARAYVGVVRCGPVTFQILPKIDYDPAGNADADAQTPAFHAATASAAHNLLHLLSYTHDLEICHQEIAPLLAGESNWFELLTRLFATGLHQQMQRGIEHAYVLLEEDLPVMRGRWQYDRQQSRRPYGGHRFDVAYDDFSPDTPLNRVFRFVVDRLVWLTIDRLNRNLLEDLKVWLSAVSSPPVITSADLDGVQFSRLNDQFRPAFNLVRMFLEGQAFRLEAGTRQAFALVLDMNRLFEQFVAQFMLRHRARILPQAWMDGRIHVQGRGQGLYLGKEIPAQRPAFKLAPDLLISNGPGAPVLILDTKYKLLDERKRQEGVAPEDAYQMLAMPWASIRASWYIRLVKPGLRVHWPSVVRAMP